jgi:hypothetical protein
LRKECREILMNHKSELWIYDRARRDSNSEACEASPLLDVNRGDQKGSFNPTEICREGKTPDECARCFAYRVIVREMGAAEFKL